MRVKPDTALALKPVQRRWQCNASGSTELPEGGHFPYIAAKLVSPPGASGLGIPPKEGRLTKKKATPRTPAMPTAFDQARDELFSHILRCGVLDAAAEHQKEWIDDTMQYISERYNDLSPEQLSQVRVLGERFCQPVVKRAPAAAEEAPAEAAEEAPAEAAEAGV
jgi:hypothetical protein